MVYLNNFGKGELHDIVWEYLVVYRKGLPFIFTTEKQADEIKVKSALTSTWVCFKTNLYMHVLISTKFPCYNGY